MAKNGLSRWHRRVPRLWRRTGELHTVMCDMEVCPACGGSSSAANASLSQVRRRSSFFRRFGGQPAPGRGAGTEGTAPPLAPRDARQHTPPPPSGTGCPTFALRCRDGDQDFRRMPFSSEMRSASFGAGGRHRRGFRAASARRPALRQCRRQRSRSAGCGPSPRRRPTFVAIVRGFEIRRGFIGSWLLAHPCRVGNRVRDGRQRRTSQARRLRGPEGRQRVRQPPR